MLPPWSRYATRIRFLVACLFGVSIQGGPWRQRYEVCQGPYQLKLFYYFWSCKYRYLSVFICCLVKKIYFYISDTQLTLNKGLIIIIPEKQKVLLQDDRYNLFFVNINYLNSMREKENCISKRHQEKKRWNLCWIKHLTHWVIKAPKLKWVMMSNLFKIWKQKYFNF